MEVLRPESYCRVIGKTKLKLDTGYIILQEDKSEMSRKNVTPFVPLQKEELIRVCTGIYACGRTRIRPTLTPGNHRSKT